MRKVIILIPVYNDWESLKKLFFEIDESINDLKNISFNCIVINDASSIIQPKISKPANIKSIKILNMYKNKGHARCNAFGIRYIIKNEDFDNLILMDGDGEDRPIEIKSLIEKIASDPNKSVVARRVKRSEGPFFQLLYKLHKIITFLFTGKNINFGNYSCLTRRDVEILSTKASLWSSYSGTVKKNLNKLNEVNSIRGLRYFGPSQMSIFKLLIHSFSIIAVFKYQVFFRSLLAIIFLGYTSNHYPFISHLIQVLICIFNLIIFIISFRENANELLKSCTNLKDRNIIKH